MGLVEPSVPERFPQSGRGRYAGAQGNGGRWPDRRRPRPRVAPGTRAGRPGLPPPRAAMDAAPALLRAPPAEVLEDVLREQFGPLPQLAAVCRLKRLPSGGYSSTEDLQLVLERRRVANAKERERVSAGPARSLSRNPAAFLPAPPRPATHFGHVRGPRAPTPRPGARGDFDLPRAARVRLHPRRDGASPATHLDRCGKRVWGRPRGPLTTSETSPPGRRFEPSEAAVRLRLTTPALGGCLGSPFPSALPPSTNRARHREPNGSYSFPYFKQTI